MSIILKILVLLTLGALVVPGDLEDDIDYKDKDDKNFTFLVTGGFRPAKHTLAKHVVSVRSRYENKFFGDNHFCGGTIVRPNVILTAAHCLVRSYTYSKRSNSEMRVVAKTPNRLKKTADTEIIDIWKVFVHPEYDPETLANDLGLLCLERPIDIDKTLAEEIELPDKPYEVGKECTVMGWGRIFENGPMAAEIMYVNVSILAASQCTEHFTDFMSGMICASDTNDWVKDACSGDSGGPMICDGKVTGIVSFGKDCGRPKTPGVYTNIYEYTAWIRDNRASGKQSCLIILLLLALVPLLM